MKPQDPETKKVLKEGETVRALVAHDGWPIVRRKYNEMVMSLGDVFSIKEQDPQKAFLQIAARQIAIELAMNWIAEVEGRARQQEFSEKAFEKIRRDAIVNVDP
jgi:hypothetical protein